MLTVSTTLDAPHDLMLLSALADDNGDDSLDEYLSDLIYDAFRLHPDYRYCPSCVNGVVPMVMVEQTKHAKHELRRSRYTTKPMDQCPDCGAATVTLDEHLDRADCCSTWKAHMRARAAALRAFPPRRRDESRGEGDVPRMEVRAVGRGPLPDDLDGFNLPGVVNRLGEIREREAATSSSSGGPAMSNQDLFFANLTRILETGKLGEAK